MNLQFILLDRKKLSGKNKNKIVIKSAITHIRQIFFILDTVMTICLPAADKRGQNIVFLKMNFFLT